MAGDKDPRASPLVGRTLKGKWRLESQIGTGGMASVWAARHRNGKRVAIKLLHQELSRDESIRARFLREGYVANKVQHPSVVTILDDEDDGDLVFLVMELLEGETLSERWKRSDRRLPLREVLRVADAVLDALAAAHDKSIVHRDVKPANIFLTTSGEVKILDFGIARLHEGPAGTGHTTRLGTSLGSPAFMSPEQARARWEFVDARTDIWAMGAVMFSCLTGRHVHGSKTSAELIIATATQPAPSLREAWPEAPDVVTAIVDRALAFERADRWQDARAMLAAVRRALQIDFDRPREPMVSLLDASVVEAVQAPPSSGSIAIVGFPTARHDDEPAAPAPADALADAVSEPAAQAPRTQVTALLPTLHQGQAPPSSDSTTSTPVAAPADAGHVTIPSSPHRSLGSMAVLGLFIAVGLIGGGVAIGLLSRRGPVAAAPAPVASAPIVSPATAPPATPPLPSASAAAVPAPAVEAIASATAAPEPSAAPPASASASAQRSSPPPPARKGRGKRRFDPPTL
jgi:serine/threonine protein kinase